MKKVLYLTLSSFVFLISLTNLSSAETTMSPEGQYIFNSLGFYLGAVLVAFMAAGFCMLESGLVTTRSVSSRFSSQSELKKSTVKLKFFRRYTEDLTLCACTTWSVKRVPKLLA